MVKAVQFIKKGGSVDAILGKYTLTPDQKAGLKKIKTSK